MKRAMSVFKRRPIIWIIDTSVFLNVLDVPNFNQDRTTILVEFEERIKAKHTFLLPYSAILETGNHIVQVNGDQKYIFAQKFATQVSKAIEGTSPWKTMSFPEKSSVLEWLQDFPNSAKQGQGFGDHSIVKEWEKQKTLFSAYSIRIWSTDTHLQGYQS